MSGLKNNLFYYATKELSQDAFICWLSSYALDEADNSDKELVNCAKNFIGELLEKGIESDIDIERVHLINVERQVENIDVLLTVKYLEKTYKIIIEDKIHSSEHDNQLERYKNLIENESIHLICIYYKTGFQSNLSEVDKAGYKLFNRNDVLNLLQKCKSENAILNNYREYWENFDEISQSYKNRLLEDWPDWQAVNGFYDEMQTRLIKEGLWAGYGYVSNKSGGFWGLWYGINDDTIEKNGNVKAAVYLQIETVWNKIKSRYDYRICVKLENKTGDKSDEDMNIIKYKIIAIQEEYGFKKPSNLRNGAYMTIGLFSDVDVTFNCEQFMSFIMKSVEQYKKMMNQLKAEINNKE